MVGGVNEVMVLEMFRSFRINFAQELNIIGDNEDQIDRRCAYTREHKLAAIDYALNTWQRLPDRSLVHISRYYASKRLKINQALLGRWIKNKKTILYQKKGTRRIRLTKTGREPEIERRLNMEFEEACDIGRRITHRWFTR
jgi:hypothetical protein